MSPVVSARPRRLAKRGAYAKSSETRGKILVAALAVAGREGLQRASVAAIAKKAGVAIGNLHYHFGSRDELLEELSKSLVGELVAAVREALEANDDFFSKDEAALRAYLAHVRRNPSCIRLAEEVRLHSPKLYAETTAMWLEMFREQVRAGVRRGELRPMDEDEIAVLAFFLLGARYFIDQMIDGADGRDYPGDEAAVAVYTHMTRRGLEKAKRS